jgi:hypothetical protein
MSDGGIVFVNNTRPFADGSGPGVSVYEMHDGRFYLVGSMHFSTAIGIYGWHPTIDADGSF